ncbi:aldehyde dehydrogenase family protein [Caulobacter sp. CCNWLY153]|uniref:aldehyde dehydrogenase family protein n=1 Tax=unclassified Caulobacter TaxID=2648921 RepID=UPI002FF21080
MADASDAAIFGPSKAALAFLAQTHGQLIGEAFVEGRGETLIEVEDPATEQVIAKVRATSVEDLDLAVAAARKAFKGWSRTSGADRARIMLRFADLLERDADQLAEIETLENGMPIALSGATIKGFCADYVRYYAGLATKLEGSTIPARANGREALDLLVYTVREPVGVVGAIVPWNVPVSMIILKLAPALASGCTLVLKSAELTPLTSILVARLWLEAGGPPGVFNLIHGLGHEIGAALVSHPGVDKITFTGSTAVGKEIVRAVSHDLKRVSLELGGKSPFVIFPDADLADAIPSAAMACFFLSGQNCMAGTRLFVHEKVLEPVLEGLAQTAAWLKVGPGLDPTTMIGPLVSARQKGRVLEHVEAAAAEGARLAYAGGVPAGPGHYVAPTVYADVTPDMRLAREEVFGPVLGVQSFGDDDEALLSAINATTYGLSGSVWTKDLSRAHRMARAIDSGQVGVNIHAALSPETPFGGNRQSGWGREFGREGIDSYLKTKAVSVNLGVIPG